MSSEALISVELEVDDALHLEHSNDSEYTRGKINDRKSKTVQWNNSKNETPVRMMSSRTAPKLPEIESNAKSFHIYQ